MRCILCKEYFQSEYDLQQICGECTSPQVDGEVVKFEPAYPGDLSELLRFAYASALDKHPNGLTGEQAKLCKEYVAAPAPVTTFQRVSYALYGVTPDQIDKLAYNFWSVHPKDIDEWEKTAPKMPEKYPGGMRAWYFACKMRDLFGKVPPDAKA